MKKFLVVLSVLALLLIAGPVQADWIDDLPLSKDVAFIGVDFSSDVGIVTLKTKDGNCMKYRIVNNEIIQMKKCNDTVWEDFTRE